jgi:hypothetical protein
MVNGGSQWVNRIVGGPHTQTANTFVYGRDYNETTGNNILINNRSGPNAWGQHLGGSRKRGGSLAGVIGTALTPGLLLAAQNRYKPKHNIYSRRRGNRRYRRRTYRR